LLPLPRSTLFPYTTLFRSLAEEGYLRVAGPARPRRPDREDGLKPESDVRHGRDGVDRGRRGDGAGGRVRPAPDVQGAGAGRPAGDRKSTRLNSSHVSISYA